MATPTTAIYRDFDLNFGIHPIKGDLLLLRDEDAVMASIRHLVLTNHYERQFLPELGSNIRKLLFEPMSEFVAEDLSRFIRETIENFEPRARVQDLLVAVNSEENGYNVTLTCIIGVSPIPQVIKFLLERVR